MSAAVGADWNQVRYELDRARNFGSIANSPWYSDAEYERFSDEEYARRHALARRAMERDGLDALLLTGSPNIYSLGGAVTWGCGLIDMRAMCQYLILPREGEPTLIYPHSGCHVEAVRRMVAVADVRGGGHGGFGKAIANRLTELGLGDGRVGVTAADRTGPEYMGVAVYRELCAELPSLELVFDAELFHELTYRKSDEEIAAMARAGELAVGAQEAVAAAARPGRREYQLAGAATLAMLDGGGQVHLAMIGSTAMDDPRLVYPNPNPSARVLRQGDLILTELSAAYLGYSAKVGHPVTIGRPTRAIASFYAKTREAFAAIEATLAPGIDLRAVQSAAGAFRRAGLQCRPMVLHGIDLITAEPRVLVEGVSARAYDDHLHPGMVVNVEATPISADGTFGLFLSRTYAVQEGGVRNLTPHPVDEVVVAS